MNFRSKEGSFVLSEGEKLTRDQVSKRVRKIVAEQLGVEEADVTEETSFTEDLNADSLDLVELVMALEEHFGAEVSDTDAEKILTVKDAVDFICEKLDI